MTERRVPVGWLTEDEVTPIESATTVLVRDRAEGFEVFMLERHVETEFAGGALVFPGGTVTAGDRALPPACWEGLDVDRAAAEMDVGAEEALGLHVAAVRETFEEAGVLLARRNDRPVVAADLGSDAFRRARERLNERSEEWDWRPWLAEERIKLDLGALAWWSWWVTPEGVHRRYSTRFFVARVPDDQIGVHDEIETVASRWLTPDEALTAGRRGDANVVYPTRKNLEGLAAYPDGESLIAACRRGEVDRRRTCPEIVRLEDGIGVRHPFTGEIEGP